MFPPTGEPGDLRASHSRGEDHEAHAVLGWLGRVWGGDHHTRQEGGQACTYHSHSLSEGGGEER